jgi:hypothetical protein
MPADAAETSAAGQAEVEVAVKGDRRLRRLLLLGERLAERGAGSLGVGRPPCHGE